MTNQGLFGWETSSSTGASTVDLDDLAARVHALAVQCESRSHSLAGATVLASPDWHYRTNAIAVLVSQISRDLQGVSTALESTSQAYVQREVILSAAAHEASSTLFWALGRALMFAAPAVIPAILGGVVSLMVAAAVTGKRPEELVLAAVGRAAQALSANEGMTGAAAISATMTAAISDPQFVDGLEYVVSGLDDFAAGMLGMPLPLIAGLGERGLGLSNPSALAGAIVVGAGILGSLNPGAGTSGGNGSGRVSETSGAESLGKLLGETAVAVTKVSTESGTAPDGIEGLLARIPRADPDMPQVRIERYEGSSGESAAFVVYLGGTIDAALMATNEPWDMTSNLSALAEMDAGSYRAAVEAMRSAGIGPEDVVTLVGHSQGGLLAARIAQSQDFRVGDVVTVGAPIHQIQIPTGVRVTAIEHTEDLVPTLGGVSLGGLTLGGVASAGVASVTTVRRSALTGRTVDPTDSLPGHNLSRYIETGKVMDASANPQVTLLKGRLAASTAGTATVTLWRAERT